jgi:hypothetical protein
MERSGSNLYGMRIQNMRRPNVTPSRTVILRNPETAFLATVTTGQVPAAWLKGIG